MKSRRGSKADGQVTGASTSGGTTTTGQMHGPSISTSGLFSKSQMTSGGGRERTATTVGLAEILESDPVSFGVSSPSSSSGSGTEAGSSPRLRSSISGLASTATSHTPMTTAMTAIISGDGRSPGSPTIPAARRDSEARAPWEDDLPNVASLSMLCPRAGCQRQFTDYDSLMVHIDSDRHGQ